MINTVDRVWAKQFCIDYRLSATYCTSHNTPLSNLMGYKTRNHGINIHKSTPRLKFTPRGTKAFSLSGSNFSKVNLSLSHAFREESLLYICRRALKMHMSSNISLKKLFYSFLFIFSLCRWILNSPWSNLSVVGYLLGHSRWIWPFLSILQVPYSRLNMERPNRINHGSIVNSLNWAAA